MWATLIRDLRCAQRQWKKSPVFVFTAVSTLALGIGMATAMFSVVYGVLLKPLPYEHPDRLVDLRELNGQGVRMHLADPNFDDIRAQNDVLEGMAGYITEISSVVTGSGEPQRIGMASVSKDFFKVMRVHPFLGRTFLPDEQHAGASQAALVGYRLWRNRLDSTTDLASKKLTIDGHPATIVGVLPDGFDFPEASEIWAPHELYETTPSRTAHNQEAVARLRDGVSLTQARAELDAIAQRLKRQYGQDIDMTGVSVVPLHDYLTGDVQKPLWILLGSMGLLLLIAFANVTSLLLARQAAREREAAVRAALGANWKRMMQQQFAETLLVAMVACVLGALFAEAAVRAISSFASQYVPRWESVQVSVPVLAAAIAVSLLIAAGLALLATSRSTQGGLQQRLREGSRSQSSSAGVLRAGRNIMVGQMAVTLVLLVAAGLLARSLQRALAVNLGFRSEQVLTMEVYLPDLNGESEYLQRSAQLGELIHRLQAIPGVAAAGGTKGLPLTHRVWDGTYIVMQPNEVVPRTMHDLTPLFHDKNRTGYADYVPADPGYLAAMSIPVLQGRDFQDSDNYDAPPVALVSTALAREKWPGQNPLGRRIEFGNMDGDLRPRTVVGVVGDVRYQDLESQADPAIYVPVAQRPNTIDIYSIALRTSLDPSSVAPTARRIARDLMPSAPIELRPMANWVDGSLGMRKFSLLLAGGFAFCALLLAVTGTYGVMAYAVEQRRREIGVRIALGATSSRVWRMVLTQGLRPALLGCALGLLASRLLARVLQSQFFEVKGYDLIALSVSVGCLLITVAVACWLPAHRATRIQPVTALREE